MIRAMRVALSGCALLACAAIPGAHGFASRTAVPDFEPPRGMRLQSIGEELRINQIPTWIWQFQSTDDADALAAHFRREWNGRIARHRVGGWDVLSHREDEWLVTIQVRSDVEGRSSRGFVAMARRFGSRERPPRRDALADVPGARIVQDLVAEDLGRRSRTLLMVGEQAPDRTLDHLRAHLREAGYAPIGPQALARSAQGGAMRLNRGTEQVDVAVADQDGRTWIAIVSVQP